MSLTTDRLSSLLLQGDAYKKNFDRPRLEKDSNGVANHDKMSDSMGYELSPANIMLDGWVSSTQVMDNFMDEGVIQSRLAVVHYVSQLLSKQRPPGVLAHDVICTIEKLPGYENCAVLLVDPETQRLDPFAISERDFGHDFSDAAENYAANRNLKLGQGIIGWVGKSGQSVRIDDPEHNVSALGFPAEICAATCVPMWVNEKVIGVLIAESRRLNVFNEADRVFLESVAAQLALAIQNAHMLSLQGAPAFDHDSGDVEHKDDKALKETMDVEHRTYNLALAEIESGYRELVKDLQTKNEELSAFNHMVAHDLKNPLSILLGFAEILDHEYGSDGDEDLAQSIQAILENGRRLENIISELLILAEVRDIEDIELEALDMKAIVTETLSRLNNLIEQYEVSIQLPEMWPIALGQRAWVEEIWVNYVSNAIKYGGEPALVELGSTQESDGMVRFWVRDNGSGISVEDRDRLFEPFSKLGKVNTKGHGLGLSIVRRIVSKLGGQVGVDSEPGEGSLFWFTLPLAVEVRPD